MNSREHNVKKILNMKTITRKYASVVRIHFNYKFDNNSNPVYIINHSFLPIQCTDGVSSKRLRHTVQNFFLCVVGSDQQCATGF